jgi:hypothetical protein
MNMKTQWLPVAQRMALAHSGPAQRRTSPIQPNKWLRYLVLCAGIVALPILLALSLLFWMGSGNWSLLPFWS